MPALKISLHFLIKIVYSQATLDVHTHTHHWPSKCHYMQKLTCIFGGVVGLETHVSNGAISDKEQQHEVPCRTLHRGQSRATEPLTQQRCLRTATIIDLQHKPGISTAFSRVFYKML